MSPEKVEAVALASVISLAFAILLSTTSLIFDKVPIVLLVWALIAGTILGHQEVRKFLVSFKLAIVPAAVLCLAPTAMALLRALLAAAANVVPDVQNFLGYSIFNPAWWRVKPLMVMAVLVVSFTVSSLLLTLCSLAGGRILSHLSTAYSAGPAAFERVEKIIKRILAILSVAGVYALLR